MNVQRYTGRSSREAMQKMRAALGEEAVVLSTRQTAQGVEMLAMAPQALAAAHRLAAQADAGDAAEPPASAATAPAAGDEVAQDVQKLAMSTLSFQDYVRERLLRKRQAALQPSASVAAAPATPPQARPEAAARPPASPPAARRAPAAAEAPDRPEASPRRAQPAPGSGDELRAAGTRRAPPAPPEHLPLLADPVDMAIHAVEQRVARRQVATIAPEPAPAEAARPAAPSHGESAMIHELRAMKGLIEERFGALAFMERLQRHPAQARLTQRLLDCGFSTALIRKLVDALPATPAEADEIGWASGVLERNLLTGEREAALEEQGGIYALIGSTGVGKTTSTAKLAAAFATRHGASQLGLITLDAYRVGAQEQLRSYGRILGVPVHTAHDRASLEDLLDLLSAKKMVLIDTAGVAQRDSRTHELLEMVAHASIRRLLVLNASAQGETLEDVVQRYRGARVEGVVLSKLDEAVKLAPALDALIRHRMKVLAIANGQRVPEDWHRLSAQALVQRALRGGGSAAWRYDSSEMNLVFAAPLPAREPASRLFSPPAR
ncbi:flagellar biosynthesis protein FlhF [Aquariibacter albus]|uniref:Flagellar biosynthesis protein FlhF n=1 Tax=Aquariibacter albus TaxID=2759899 RepID=A0A839HM09_9BURK|nr:flagellar biosynthesis protein FlhF [Aquariibacter albus]MBB1160608.1 flagellar biosynthesis protein FlhF [Aquariibacter albus]